MQQNREDQIKYRTLPNFYYDTNDANQLNRILDTNNYPYKNWHTVKKHIIHLDVIGDKEKYYFQK